MLQLLSPAIYQLAQMYRPQYSSPSGSGGSFGAGILVTLGIVALLFVIVIIVSTWKVFTKAGKPGWAVLVPFYNYLVMLEIVGRPAWWILAYVVAFIPFVGLLALIPAVIVTNDLSKSFGKGVGFTILLLLLPIIGFPMLGFGDARYLGPAAKGSVTPGSNGNNDVPPVSPTPPNSTVVAG